MRLPHFTAAQSLGFRSSGYPAAALSDNPPGQIVMMVDIECLNGCVGSTAYECVQRCGSDLNCWQECAGPSSISCVQSCYQNG